MRRKQRRQEIQLHALIFHTLSLNLSEEVGVFCRLRVVLTAEGRGVFLSNFLTGILEGERPLLQDGPGPNKR